MEAEQRNNLTERLIVLADLMEVNSDNPALMKTIRKEYKFISNQLYPKDKSKLFSAKEIKESKQKALENIKRFLEVEDVDGQFASKVGGYHSNEKFILTWFGNYKGMKVEYTIDKTDSFYSSYSGYKCIKAIRNLFLEKQLKGYHSIERALLEVGMGFLRGQEKQEFFDRYATVYNARLKNE